ncbi:MAG: SDR family oxidoreductase [Deltaproteobacteria bacterium]|nr:SDR family oxidoreductase [Deltaproteobacteria bacterium]
MRFESFFRGKKVLITGGSSGIGLALAQNLSTQGCHIHLLARNRETLDSALEIIRSIQNNPSVHIGAVSADVRDPDSINEAIDRMSRDAGLPDFVINSAGVSHPGCVQDLDLEIFRRTMDVNYHGTVHVTKAVLPGMIERGSGHIINISSVAGFLGVFGYTAYCASKFAVMGFSDTLRAEVKPLGIRVSVALPPDTETPMFVNAEALKPYVTKALSKNVKAMSAESVAAIILRDIARGKYLILPGFETKMLYFLTRISGTMIYPIMDYLIARAAKTTERKNFK